MWQTQEGFSEAVASYSTGLQERAEQDNEGPKGHTRFLGQEFQIRPSLSITVEPALLVPVLCHLPLPFCTSFIT